MNEYMNVLRKYAVFSGRARRREYWMFVLFNLLIYMSLFIVAAASKINAFMILYWLYALATLIPSLAVAVRRLHDINKSGWFMLIGLIPFVGGFILLYFMVQDSQPGDNQYGPNPKGVTAPVPAS